MTERPTPETDAFSVKFKSVCGSKAWVPTDICRRFEREQDELRIKLMDALEKVGALLLTNERLKQERNEAQCESEQQARLLGMSGEREMALRGKIFELERKILQLEAK